MNGMMYGGTLDCYEKRKKKTRIQDNALIRLDQRRVLREAVLVRLQRLWSGAVLVSD